MKNALTDSTIHHLVGNQMINYTCAFCLIPFPKNNYEEFIVEYPGSTIECYKSISRELGNNVKLYTNATNCYIWYANVKRSSPTGLVTFTDTENVRKLIKQCAEKEFSHYDNLDIIFSVHDIGDMACTLTGNYYNVKLNEKRVTYGSIEKNMINDLLKGPELYAKWCIYDIEENEKLSKIIPPDPPKNMRSWKELIDAVETNIDSNAFFTPADTIINFLPYYYAKKYLANSYTYYDWDTNKSIPHTRDGIIDKMKERLEFLSEKYEDNRGLSTAKALMQVQTLCWLLKDDQYDTDKSIPKFIKYVKKTYLNANECK